MIMHVVYSCAMGFFMGRMIVKGALSVPVLVVLTLLTFLIPFFFAKFHFDTRKAWVSAGLAMSTMILTIGVILVSREIQRTYQTNPVFHDKVNAYVFMDPRYQAQLDSYWFEKKRAEIDRHTLDVERMRFVCGDPAQYREIVRNYNLAINRYNKVVVGSMVGLQYAEPVKQLLSPHFNNQLVPCGSVFKTL